MPNNFFQNDYSNTRFKLFLQRITDLRIDLTDKIINRAREMFTQNISAEVIKEEIYAMVLNSIPTLENKEAKEIWNVLKSVSQFTMWQGLANGIYRWQYTPGAAHCKGCLDRNGQDATLQEWESRGLPGSGVTECQDNCLCDLRIVKKGKS